MISKNTVIVLGAGASNTVNFPTNPQLVDRICETFKQTNGHYQTARDAGFDEGLIENFRKSLFESQQPSIDSYLNLQRGYLDIGRFAVATEILSWENHDSLMNVGRTKWYRKFVHALGTAPADAQVSAQKLSIINFNYDRSLEHFTHTALHHSANPGHQVYVTTALQNLKFRHIHGNVGILPWRDNASRPYGYKYNGRQILDVSKNILLAHELQKSQFAPFPDAPTELIANAEQVFFFGFAFHRENQATLGLHLDADRSGTQFFASDKGLSENLKRSLHDRFKMKFFPSIDDAIPELSNFSPQERKIPVRVTS